MRPPPPNSTLFPYTTLFRSGQRIDDFQLLDDRSRPTVRDDQRQRVRLLRLDVDEMDVDAVDGGDELRQRGEPALRSEEHTSELQSRRELVCRLLLEKKKRST